MKIPESSAAARVAELEKQLADLKARLPAHSVPASMMVELDELEEELALARRQWREAKADEVKSHPGGGN
jgi:chromosome segregation ATPase